jgi:hypothetical protein
LDTPSYLGSSICKPFPPPREFIFTLQQDRSRSACGGNNCNTFSSAWRAGTPRYFAVWGSEIWTNDGDHKFLKCGGKIFSST